MTCLLLVSTENTYANTNIYECTSTNLSKDVRERVYDEVISGNITNEADVLKVALEQYEERIQKAQRLTPGKQIEDDGSLSITQVTGTYTDKQGEVFENITTTNLLVLDENDNIVRADRMLTSGSAQLSDYSIYGTMNVNVTLDKSNLKVRINSFVTKLTYGTAMKAGILTQGAWHAEDLVTFHSETEKNYANPDQGKNYQFVPTFKQMVPYNMTGSGAACYSIVKVGSRGFGLSYNVQGKVAYPDGEWHTEYYK